MLDFTGANGSGDETIMRFIDRLIELPAVEWIEAGTLAKASAADRALPIHILESLVTDSRFRMAAWYVTDNVETAAFLALQSGRCEARPRPMMEARRAAEIAAHALLLRGELSPEAFELLYLPFRDHIRLEP